MEETLTLSNLDQLKAIADPLRQRMLELFCLEPTTTKQVAERLRENPTKLYHHLNVLESAGLVCLIETRQNRGTLEKYYRSVARHFVVDHRLLALSAEGEAETNELRCLLVNTLQAGLSEACRCLEGEPYVSEAACMPAVAGQMRIRTSKARAAELAAELETWLSALQSAHDAAGEVTYGVTLTFHPVAGEPASVEPEKE